MRELVLYIGVFLIVYLFYIIFVLKRKNVLKKFMNGKELSYLKIKYGIKTNDKNIKSISNKIFLANSFILTITLYVVCRFKSFIMGILVGMVVLFILILVLYHLIGIYYKNKQGGKHV